MNDFCIIHLYMKSYLPQILAILFIYGACGLHFDTHEIQQGEVCWINAYDRAQGLPNFPNLCGWNRVRIKNKCYVSCPIEYSRIGEDCYKRCPLNKGWEQKGEDCNLVTQYDNGVGYGKQAGEKDDTGMKDRCTKANPKDYCQKNGQRYFPRCMYGFKNEGCCVCKPIPLGQNQCINRYGMKAKTTFSCSRPIIKGDPQPVGCQNFIEDAGLCYINQCPQGYDSIGSLCLQKGAILLPRVGGRWLRCPYDGLLFGRDLTLCDKIVLRPISKIGGLAYNIVHAFRRLLANMKTNYAKLYQLTQNFNYLRELTKNNEQLQKAYQKYETKFPTMIEGKNYDEVLGIYADTYGPSFISGEDMIRLSEIVVYVVSMELKGQYQNCDSLK